MTLITKIHGYQATALMLNTAAIVAIWLLPWTYLVGAVIFYVIATPMTQLIFHEYLSHLQIKPKNRAVASICMWIFCVLGGRFYQKFAYHQHHHRYWKQPDLDPTQQKINQNTFLSYISGIGRPVPQQFEQQPHPWLQTDVLMQFFNRHADLIQIVTIILSAAVLPIEIFAVVFVLYPWMLMIVFAYHDWRFHAPNSTAQDMSLWFPLFANQAWHIRHHTDSQELYFGPGQFRWINPSWYLFKSGFDPT